MCPNFQVCDPLVTGAIPRLAIAAICVPLVTRGGAITAIVPFYMSTKVGLNARVVPPRHHAIPRLGWVGKGNRVSQALREHRLAPQLLSLMRRFTCTTYDGALLLRALAAARPDLTSSMTAVTTTLSNYARHRQDFKSGPSIARSATRSLAISAYSKVRALCALPSHAPPPPWAPPLPIMHPALTLRATASSRTWRLRRSGILLRCAWCTTTAASAFRTTTRS